MAIDINEPRQLIHDQKLNQIQNAGGYMHLFNHCVLLEHTCTSVDPIQFVALYHDAGLPITPGSDPWSRPPAPIISAFYENSHSYWNWNILNLFNIEVFVFIEALNILMKSSDVRVYIGIKESKNRTLYVAPYLGLIFCILNCVRKLIVL